MDLLVLRCHNSQTGHRSVTLITCQDRKGHIWFSHACLPSTWVAHRGRMYRKAALSPGTLFSPWFCHLQDTQILSNIKHIPQSYRGSSRAWRMEQGCGHMPECRLLSLLWRNVQISGCVRLNALVNGGEMKIYRIKSELSPAIPLIPVLFPYCKWCYYRQGRLNSSWLATCVWLQNCAQALACQVLLMNMSEPLA